MKQEYIYTDEVPQDKLDNTEGGGSNSHKNEREEVSINWWYVAGIAMAIVVAVVLSIILLKQ